MIAILGAQVMTAEGLIPADLVVEGDTVTSVGSVSRTRGEQVLDATGLIVGPGLVDIHTHLRDPGETWKEDLESGCLAALAGGYTALVGMPNTVPAADTVDLIREIEGRASELGLVEVRMAAALTVGRSGETLTNIDALYRAGVRIFSDDGNAVAEEALLRKAMSEASRLAGAIIAEHAEDHAATMDGSLHAGEAALALGLSGWPAETETSIIGRDLALAAETGATLHVQHVSTADGVRMIDEAKAGGVRVTAEVTPHHLTLVDEDITEPDPNFKMYPPLRTKEDRRALVEALRSGVIDIVATDHAPHTDQEKDVGFAAAPRGVIGLETALPLALSALDGDIPALFETMSIRPARIAGMQRQGTAIAAGAPANLVIIDPERRWLVREFRSRSANSPFIGRELRGEVVATVYEGRLHEVGGH